MKKLVGVVAVLLLVGAVAVPWVVGFTLERQMRAQIAELPQASVLDITISEYDRGWFSSRIVARIGFRRFMESFARRQAELSAQQQGVPLDEEELIALFDEQSFPLDIAFVTEAQHGPITSLADPRPVLARTVTTLDPETPGLKELEAQLGVGSLFTADAVYELNGRVQSTVRTPQIDVDEEEVRVEIAAARFDSTYSMLSGEVEMTGGFPLLSFTGDQGHGRIDAIRFELAGRLVESQLFAGTSVASIDGMEISILDVETGVSNDVEMTEIVVESETEIDEDASLMSARQTMRLAAVSVGTLGSIEDAEFVTTIESLDLDLMREWTKLSNELAMGAPPDDPLSVFAPLASAFDEALRRSPRIALDPIRATVDGEEFEFSIRLAADGDRVPEGAVTDDPIALIDAVNGEVQARVPRWAALQIVRGQLEPQANAAVQQGQATPEQAAQWLEQQTAAMLDNYVMQGLVQFGADGYRMLLALEDGVVSINGQPLPIDLETMIEAQRAAAQQSGPSI